MSTHEMTITYPEACRLVAAALAHRDIPAETVGVRQAYGRVVQDDQVSRLDLPPFRKSAMDGYAVPLHDEREAYRLLETVAAGELPAHALAPGTTVKVMTGAPVPGGTGKVIMRERTEEVDGMVRVLSPERAANICEQGEDVRCGETILRAATRLGALEIANLLACGVEQIRVNRPLRVGIVSTGDEIVESFAQLTAGKIIDTNGPLLLALCAQHGLAVVTRRLIPDNRATTIATLQETLESADLVLLSGGVSEGDFDYVGDALAAVGLTVHFNRVAIKPGKPLTFASSREKAAFGLPGNPISVYLMFHLFVLRAASLLMGGSAEVREVRLPLADEFARRKADRREYVPCRVTTAGTLRPIAYHGSAHLLALMESDGFMAIPQGTTQLPAGEHVDFLPTRWGEA